jgi:hypothetical protein
MSLSSAEVVGLEPLYDRQGDGTYLLKTAAWTGIATLDHYRILADRGFFNADRVPEDIFRRMLAAAPKEPVLNSILPDNADYDVLSVGYVFEPETATYHRAIPSADSQEDYDLFLRSNAAQIDMAFRKYVVDAVISNAEREVLALVKGADGEGYVLPRRSGDAYSYDRKAPSTAVAPRILSGGARLIAMDGDRVEGYGLLLDTRMNPATGLGESLWLAEGELHRIDIESGGVISEYSGASPSVAEGSGTLVVRMKDHGIERGFEFAGKTGLVESIPEDLYENRVGERALSGKAFSTDSFFRMPSSSRDAIAAALSNTPPAKDVPSDREIFTASYLPDGLDYVLDLSIENEALERVLGLVHARSIASSEAFRSLPNDASGVHRRRGRKLPRLLQEVRDRRR